MLNKRPRGTGLSAAPPLAAALALALACTVSSPVSRTIGARCQSQDDCDGVCLSDPSYPDGFCSVVCDGQADCPSGTLCTSDGQGVCLFFCAEAADCEFLGAGWSCATRPGHPEGDVRVCAGP